MSRSSARVPNLFDYAPSELTQDAFLAWLLAWSDPTFAARDPCLHATGRRFLAALFERSGHAPPPSDAAVEIRREHKDIDLLATVGDRAVVAIEDKVANVHHPGQLLRYREHLEAEFPLRDRVLIYLTTIEQATALDVEAQRWKPFVREDLIETLRPARDQTDNAILSDFLDRLEGIDARVKAYRTEPLDQWDEYAWRGYFSRLQPEFGGHWDHVPGEAGGFMGFWWGFFDVPDAQLYLQLEEELLVVKIHVVSGIGRSAVRDLWSAHVLRELGPHGFGRPKHLTLGETMTVACYEFDPRVVSGGKLDFAATVARLKELTRLLRRVAMQVSRERDGSLRS